MEVCWRGRDAQVEDLCSRGCLYFLLARASTLGLPLLTSFTNIRSQLLQLSHMYCGSWEILQAFSTRLRFQNYLALGTEQLLGFQLLSMQTVIVKFPSPYCIHLPNISPLVYTYTLYIYIYIHIHICICINIYTYVYIYILILSVLLL